jgi:hypothetical protein
MNKILGSVLIFSLFVSGCSNISSRIKENERQFNNYPPEVQSQIQSGHIDHGFTEEMVYMAKGKPNEKSTIEKNGKTLTLWKYASPMPATPMASGNSNVNTPYGYPSFGPGPSQPASIFYDRKYFKVEFENGKVVNWDQELNE